MLEKVFILVLNMTFTASIVAGVIISLRFILNKKLPKTFSYALWVVVLVRLLLPATVSTGLSIFNVLPSPVPEPIIQNSQSIGTLTYIPDNIGLMQKPSVDTGSKVIDESINHSLPRATPFASINPMQVIIFALSWVWVIGALSLFTYSIVAYIRTAKRLKEAVLYQDDTIVAEAKAKLKMKRDIQIFTSDRIDTPVVFGLMKPRIILPLSLMQNADAKALQFIHSHELIHIKRFDYITKPLSVLALCLHWFNPLVWLSFSLAQKDMEMSCDERVMGVWEEDVRREYANILINLAAQRHNLPEGSLLAFGESNIKGRIKGIGNYKKPGFWLAAVSLITLIAVGILLLTNNNFQDRLSMDKPVAEDTSVKDPGISAIENVAVSKPIDHQFLIDQLDKESDDAIKYVYELTPDNIVVDITYEGNFTSSGKQELLVIFKLLNMPHAGGLDCSVAAVYDRSTCNIISQKTFPYDECTFRVLTDETKRNFLLFIGSTTYQGYSWYTLQLWKMGQEWELLYPEGSTNNSEEKKYELINNETIAVSYPIKSKSEDPVLLDINWVHEYNLVWNKTTCTLDKVILN